MVYSDLLPDSWGLVAYKRYRELRDSTIKEIREKKRTVDACLSCPGFCACFTEDYVYTWCRFNKCIRQYPHIRDRGEFT